MKHIVITGGRGQLGLELERATWPADVVLQLPDRAALDLELPGSITAYFAVNPCDLLVNAAAYTAVDRAEDDIATAYHINAVAPALLAGVARERSFPIVHVSTDYVFDGSKSTSYVESDPVAPLGVYGAGKLAGEQAVLTTTPRAVVLRTAWVLSAHRANFLKTMLRLGKTQEMLRIVDDQFGCPTAASDIAGAIVTIAQRLLDDACAPCGTYHFVNAGSTSWFGLATAIFTYAAALGHPHPILQPTDTAGFPTRARRPANSRLDCTKIGMDYDILPRAWQPAVRDIVTELLSPHQESQEVAP